jgi:TPR repeat protein
MKFSDNPKVTLESFNAFLSALEDDIHTLLVMGDAYRWGNEEVEPDATMAMEYYREAAELGDWEAMGLLADMLEEQGRVDEAKNWREHLEAELRSGA